MMMTTMIQTMMRRRRIRGRKLQDPKKAAEVDAESDDDDDDNDSDDGRGRS
jgi:hypothetical protein